MTRHEILCIKSIYGSIHKGFEVLSSRRDSNDFFQFAASLYIFSAYFNSIDLLSIGYHIKACHFTNIVI